jgi:uncharacterized protein (DUF169 family)
MDSKSKERFIRLWLEFFGKAELPIAFYYTNEEGKGEPVKHAQTHRCIIADLTGARRGKSLCFDGEAVGCGGGKRYLGFAEKIMPNFEYFLSYGIPGKLEGERYKKNPEMVKEAMKHLPQFKAPARFIVFKRWDRLDETDDPEVVIFFAPPDVLSGLFTLANFDEAEPNGVVAPFAAGCASIVQYPYLEKGADRPRGVLGLFDVSARPCVGRDELTFSLPMNRFLPMIDNMEESFLMTPSWNRVRERLGRNRR